MPGGKCIGVNVSIKMEGRSQEEKKKNKLHPKLAEGKR